jgi:hypothetical protein
MTTIKLTQLEGLTLLAMTVIVASCGGGDDASQDVQPQRLVDRKVQAARQTVSKNAVCTALSPFYWEIGDKNGMVVSGTGGTPNTDYPTAPSVSKPLQIASASKWLYGAYVLEQRGASGPDAINDVPFLNFTSGYTNFRLPVCPGSSGTIDQCLNSSVGNNGVPRGTLSPENVGKFFYDSGHLQRHASNIGLGDATGVALGSAVSQALGITLEYSDAQPAGSGIATAVEYTTFLRKILNRQLRISQYLGKNAVCTWHDRADCNAVTSPTDSTPFHWHYSLGHWVEDDDANRAFSSAGAFGYYPWVSSDQLLYGLIARQQSGTQQHEGFRSAECGRVVRLAYQTGVNQTH